MNQALVDRIMEWLEMCTREIVEDGDTVEAVAFGIKVGPGDTLDRVTIIDPSELMNTDSGKDVLMMILRRMTALPGIDVVAFLDESWVSLHNIIDPLPSKEERQKMQRDEGIMYHLYGKDPKDDRHFLVMISRAANGRRTLVGHPVETPKSELSGRFVRETAH